MGASTSKFKTKGNKYQPSTIHEKPLCPTKPTLKPNLENTDPDIITIQWEPPLSNGGYKITGYVVEHRRIGSPHWVKATPINVCHPQLTLSGLEPGWRYQFRVSAENAFGLSEPSPVSEPLAISLHKMAAIAPYFIVGLHDIRALENEKVEFSVKFQGVPNPKIMWYKDGFEIYSNRNLKIATDDNLSTLIIHEILLSDEGEFKCSATNRAGHVITRANLIVKAPPTIRFARQYEDGLLFEKGDIIKLKVSVVGQPTPTVNWFHNGTQLQKDRRCDITFADKVSTLKIKDARRFDRGEYQIHAVNAIGEDAASIMVTIAYKPEPPGKVTIINTSENLIHLSWAHPEDDGGCKIGCYIVEYYKIGWNVWLKAASCRHLTTTLENLIEGAQYKFRVKAENPYGVSEAGPESEVIYVANSNKKHCIEDEGEPSSYIGVAQNFDTTQPEMSNTKFEKSPIPEKPKRKRNMENENKWKEMETVKCTSDKINSDKQSIFDGCPKTSPNQSENTSPCASELMLLLLPHKHSETKITNLVKYNSDGNIFNQLSIAPPMSLSAPELGSDDDILFEPLQRNCVSSTELLHESTTARVYKDMHNIAEEQTLYEESTYKNNLNEYPREAKSKDLTQHPHSSQTNVNYEFNFGDLTLGKHVGQTCCPFETKNDKENKYQLGVSHSQKSVQPEFTAKKLSYEEKSSQYSLNSNERLASSFKPNVSKFDTGSAYSKHKNDPFANEPEYFGKTIVPETLDGGRKYKPTSSSISDVVREVVCRKSTPVQFFRSTSADIASKSANDDISDDGDSLEEDENHVLNESHARTKTKPNFYIDFDTERVREKVDIQRIWDRYDGNKNVEDGSIFTNGYDDVGEEEEENDSTEDDSVDYENDTYHPEEMTPLFFERAVEYPYTGGRKRIVSPTNDTSVDDVAEIERRFKASTTTNEKYRPNEHSQPAAATTLNVDANERSLKPILKHQKENGIANHAPNTYNNKKTDTWRDTSHKKHVRIEEPDKMERQQSEISEPPIAVIDQYSNIVKQYGKIQKSTAKVYLTYEELKAAAQQLEKENEIENRNSSRNLYAVDDGTDEQKDHNDDRVKNSTDEMSMVKAPEVDRVNNRVHFMFDFSLDVVMFFLACWIYCFEDVRLAIPIVALMIYRQLYEQIKNKLSSFRFWKKKSE